MPISQGGRTLDQVAANRFVKDIDPQIKWDYASSAPFFVLLGLSKKTSGVCKSEEPKWQQRSGVPRQVNSEDVETDAATAIDFTDATWKILRETDILENDRTREQIRIAATPATKEVTVVRGYAGTTAAALVAGDTWTRLGNAQGYWSDTPDLIGTDPTEESNYVQRFRHPFGADDRLVGIGESGGNIGPKEIDYLDEDTYRDHVESVERALVRGIKNKTGDVTTMGGIDYFLT